jgi:hypothetical protein
MGNSKLVCAFHTITGGSSLLQTARCSQACCACRGRHRDATQKPIRFLRRRENLDSQLKPAHASDATIRNLSVSLGSQGCSHPRCQLVGAGRL